LNAASPAPARVRLGFRARLLAVSIVLIGLFALGSAVFLYRIHQPSVEAQARSTLGRMAALAAPQLAADGALSSVAQQTGARALQVDAAGAVIGDSMPDAGRPVAGPSAWLAPGSVWVTASAPLPDGGALWLARPRAEVLAPVRSVRTLLLGVGACGMFVSLLMTVLASRLMSRDLRLLLDQTTAIARGAPVQLTRSSTAITELADIAGSVRELSSAIDRVVRDLYTERRRFEAVLGGMREAVVALDRHGNVTLVNPSGCALFGVDDTQYGRPLLEVIRVPDLADAARRAADGAPTTVEFDLRRIDESPRRLQAVASPLETGGVVMVLHDYTKVRRLERVRKDFVANVSHELRTPVAIVQASAEALEEGALEDPEYAADFIGAISRNAARLAMLIDDLLKISQMEEGRLALEREPVYLSELVEQVLGVLRPRLGARIDTLSVDVGADHVVLADAGALEQVLVNLLENARKYTPPDCPLEVRSRATGDGFVRVEVADTGPGIAAHHRPRIFERFYRVDPGRARQVGGTGLGLAIVKHLAEAMDGQVGVDANAPRGAVFWVSLPEASAAEVPAAAAEPVEADTVV